jgi:gamma-glutamylputrescine oxidase
LIGPSSYYEDSAPVRLARLLAGRAVQVQVAVLGGGFAGLGTACSLQERGVSDVAVLDAQGVGHGASGRNGGFVLAGFSREPAGLLRDIGPAAARNLYASSSEAVALIRSRIERHAIACAPTEGGALWLDWFDSPRSRAAMASHRLLLQEQFGVQWQTIEAPQVRQWLQTERYGGALFDADAFHFHPLAYARGLAAAVEQRGGHVFEHSAVRRVEQLPHGWRVYSACGGTIDAQQLLMAGGGYLRRLAPPLERARLPIATYVVTTEPLAVDLQPIRTPAALYDNRFAFDYYRKLEDGRILWGGRISILNREPAAIARFLKRDLLKVYPQLASVRLTHAWGGLMAYATHEMPQIGQLAPGLWYAQAFGGHGVAPTTLAGEWVARAMLGEQALPEALQRYGLSSVFGHAGLLAAQVRYSWAELRDAINDRG